LLVGAVQRLNGSGGDPVVQLQTNFGGGKTHSMLALYHLFAGVPPGELLGIDAVLAEAGSLKPPKVNRVVLVGNKISPGNPVVKADGTIVRTLWGELAWQLGHAAGGIKEAKKAFQRVAADDEKATSPGDVLRELMNDYGPCLILIDEWVAYARQLHDAAELPAGSFETHFTFAQALTESAKLAKRCLLVISLPASDTGSSPHAYLPRLSEPAVLLSAIRDGLGLLTWEKDSFAYADHFDEKAGRYRGLRHGQLAGLSADSPAGLLVRPEIATQQLESETRPPTDATKDVEKPGGRGPDSQPPPRTQEPPKHGPRRFHGSVTLDPARVGRDAGRIADEIISHLTGLMGSTVKVTLEIEPEIPSGAPDQVVRTVTENSRTLKFTSQGFEAE
jgi:hypothetical protein